MKLNHLLATSWIHLMFLTSFAQTKPVSVVETQSNNKAFVDALSSYEKAAEKGYKDEATFLKLGNSYYYNGNLQKAERWYGELYLMNKNQEPEFFFKYSQCLLSVGKNKEADEMLVLFNEKSGNDSRAKLFRNNKDYLDKIKNKSGRFKVMELSINSDLTDFGASLSGNKIVFASGREPLGILNKATKWSNESNTDLYSSEFKEDGTFDEPKLFSKTINSIYNESTPIFTKDGLTMFFTRNNYLNGKKGNNDKRTVLLKLYKASLVDGEWKNIVELPFNSDQYNVAHPALSKDEHQLYFASDMPGTIGQSDIFKVSINADGTYSKPENLGSTVNTEGRETFPFISGDDSLYYSSDGRPGLGGLDVYVSKINADSTFGQVENIGSPINGPADDFALSTDYKTNSGFFTSNRAGGKGSDDIYKFTEKEKPPVDIELKGSIRDKESLESLKTAKISLFDEKFILIGTTTSDEKGYFTFLVKPGNYYVRAELDKFDSNEIPVKDVDASNNKLLSIYLEKRFVELTLGSDLAKVLNIPVIYFDVNKTNIREDAAYELEKLFTVLTQSPTIKIDIRSHTDSRQSAENNLVLSEKRAAETKKWLIGKGIDSNRLTSKGFGESKLINKCADGVECTETEHQANRRSEFIVVSLN